MTQEDKSILLKDLSARSPYGVKCKIRYTFNNETTFGEDVEAEEDDVLVKIDPQIQSAYFDWYGDFISIENFKPYLRPMSSMTEEEEREVGKLGVCYDGAFHNDIYDVGTSMEEAFTAISWLLERHFDINYLIQKGLALEAPDGMYE